jgi:SAM-dependent methyltransferase
MIVDVSAMHQSNRHAWDEGAARYDEQFAASVARLRAGHALYPPELRFLGDLRAWCRRAIHLQCAGGEDTLSLWKLGAGEVVGVDISDAMIAIARRKSAALEAPARWFQSDVLGTPHELDGTADLVYTGKGALNWLHDIDGWAGVVARLLIPGGRFYLYEGHPITWIFEQEADTLKLDPHYGDYFSERAEPGQGWPATYIGELSRPKDELAVKWERQWPLGTVMNALIAAGLRVERFEEHPDSYWERFPNMPEELANKFPHTYSLLMRKDGV